MRANVVADRVPIARAAGRRHALLSDTGLLVALALVKLLAHLLVAGNYGYFRDELYYIDAGRHLQPGYVEFPPFVAVLAALLRALSGDALVALHVVSALAGALVVLLTGLMARELGGGRFAQGLAALASLAALTFLAIDSIFSMDPWDELWWVLAAYVVMRLIRRDRPRLWLLVGLIVGLGLFTKVTMLFFGAALAAGLLLTPRRVDLRTRWPWLAVAIAILFLLPYALWNAANGWPTLEFWGQYGGHHTIDLSFLGYLGEQIYVMNPLTLPLWLAGLCYYFSRDGRPYRLLGWAFVVLFALFAIAHAKSYFLAPAYPMLFAAGAVVAERATRTRRRPLRPVYVALLVVSALLLAPIAMPLLPPATWVRAYGFLGGDAGAQQERHTTGVLPQWLADRFGWDTLTATVARVYRALPPQERAEACVFTLNYGEAGAIDLLGRAYHLPRAVSGHNTYYLWGPDRCSSRVVITVGLAQSDVAATFASVTRAATVTCRYCMPEEDGIPIYVGRGPKRTLTQIWPTVKHYD